MITTVTLNASIDKAYHMDRKIVNGSVMRVAKTCNSAGGKGLNVARVIKLCGETTKATGLVGGYNGQYLEHLLTLDDIPHDFEHVAGETRSCINILDEEYGSTEYLEGGCQISPEEEANFLSRFSQIIEDSQVVTLSGSAPQGMHKDIYGKLVSIAKEMGKMVILDTSGELLKEGIAKCPTLVKPNKDEIEMLFDIKIVNRDEVLAYARKIYESGVPYVVISLGGDGAVLICEEGTFQAIPPKMDVVNTVGCGDSMVGALAVALKRGMGPEEALKYASSVASANAMSPRTGNFEPKMQQEIFELVKVTRID